jgi:hypothetical protein
MEHSLAPKASQVAKKLTSIADVIAIIGMLAVGFHAVRTTKEFVDSVVDTPTSVQPWTSRKLVLSIPSFSFGFKT